MENVKKIAKLAENKYLEPVFKGSKVHLLSDIFLIGDKGYQKIKNYHKNSLTPELSRILCKGRKITSNKS
jgi:hypothetical protein